MQGAGVRKGGAVGEEEADGGERRGPGGETDGGVRV